MKRDSISLSQARIAGSDIEESSLQVNLVPGAWKIIRVPDSYVTTLPVVP